MNEPMHSVKLTRTINASASDIYASWTNPARMQAWLGKVSADVRVGGRYRIESDGGGGKTYIYTGEYLVLEPPRRVVQSFLAGDPGARASSPYSNEFLEVRLRELGPLETEMTFVNGWDGEGLTEEGIVAVKDAWSGWLDLMEESVGKPSSK